MLEDEGLVNFMDRLSEIYQEDYCVLDQDQALTDAIYASGNYLFRNPCTFNLAGYRDLPYDFGILPMPKLNEAQDGYYSYCQPWATATPMIPVTTQPEDLAMVGTIIDAMCAYGYDYVRPAVFDNVIQLKGTRDEKSAEIIDLMFENITFEMATLFGGDMYSMLQRHFTNLLGKKDITTAYAAIKSKSEKHLEKLLAEYSEVHNDISAALGK